MAACGMFLNVGLNFYLIPRHYAFGAAISSAITQFITAFAQIILSHKKFRFRLDFKLLTAFAIFTILVISFNYGFGLYVENWIYGMLFSAICALIAAFALRLINIPVIYSILKNDEE